MDVGGVGCSRTNAWIFPVPKEDTPWTIPSTFLQGQNQSPQFIAGKAGSERGDTYYLRPRKGEMSKSVRQQARLQAGTRGLGKDDQRCRAASLKAEGYARKAWGRAATRASTLPVPGAREGGVHATVAGGIRMVASKVSLKGGLRSSGSEWCPELSHFCQIFLYPPRGGPGISGEAGEMLGASLSRGHAPTTSAASNGQGETENSQLNPVTV